MSLVATAYFRVFEPFLSFSTESRRKTTEALRSARINMLPEWYLSLTYLVSAGAAAAGLLTSLLVLTLMGSPGWVVGLAATGATVVAFLATRLGFLVYPRLAASGRGRAVDAEFPSVVTLCYALARGGLNAMDIFRIVAEEREAYGEISVEFGQVIREIDRLGKDLNSALMSVASTTPSPTLRGFFEGLVTILNSGADPRDYFKRQASMQIQQAGVTLEKEVEQAGLLAETYVSGLLVLPLLLIVVLTVLSALKNSGSGFVNLIVFVLIPGGTVMFLLLLETLLPPDALSVPHRKRDPLNDFGMSTLSPDLLVLPPPRAATVADVADDLAHETAGEKDVRRLVQFEWMKRRAKSAWMQFADRAFVKPTESLQVSGIVAIVLLGAGAAVIMLRGLHGKELTIAATSLGLLGVLVALLPVAIFHEMRVHHTRKVDASLPEMLGKLAGFNEKGVSLLKSFQILGNTGQGPMAKEMRALDRDVGWTANLRGALGRLRDRVSTRRMAKLGILFERGIGATGNLKEVLEIAAADSNHQEGHRVKKQQAMMTYIVVVYVVFAVFLYVVYMVTDLFYGSGGFAAAASESTVKGISAGIAPDTAQLLFFHGVLLQGVCCGFVAGKLGEGHILSGIKHAAIMGIIAWAVFQFGIFA